MRTVISVKPRHSRVCMVCQCEYDTAGWWVQYASENDDDDPFDLLKITCDECAEKAKREIANEND